MASEGRDNHHDEEARPVSGLDGVLCPVCGEVVKSLPILVHRIIGDGEERFRVCSLACKQTALRSRYLQTNLFGRDLRAWSRSRQGALPISDRKDGRKHGTDRGAGDTHSGDGTQKTSGE